MLVYYCPEGYYPYPHLTKTCQQNGAWKSSPVSRRALPQRCRRTWWRRCFSFSFFCPYLLHLFALQWLSVLTPTFWRPATSHLLRKSTLWTTRPPTSVTLDTRCEAHPYACAYQTGSGAAPLPSAAATVSPTLSPFSSLSIATSQIFPCSSMQRGITVPILVFQLVGWDQATYLELMTKSNTAAPTSCSWWDPVKGRVRRTASGQAPNQHVTVRHNILDCALSIFLPWP